MSTTQNLNDIFSELDFSEKERIGFNQAIQAAKDYIRNGDVDMEERFKSIVKKVVNDEI